MADYEFNPISSAKTEWTKLKNNEFQSEKGSEFWGFSESDEHFKNIVKYPISQEVVDAIKQCLESLPYEAKTKDGKQYWGDVLSGEEVGEARPAIRAIQQIFKGCEVIPYVFPVNYFPFLNSSFTDENMTVEHNNAVLSSVGDMNKNQYTTVQNGPKTFNKTPFSTWLGMEVRYICTNSSYSAWYNKNLANKSAVVPLSPGMQNAQYCGVLSSDSNKPQLNTIADTVVLPHVLEYTKDENVVNNFYMFNSESSLSDASEAINANDLISGRMCCRWIEDRENNADGEYSESNPRGEGLKRIDQSRGVSLTGLNNYNIGTYVFFVKTFSPWEKDNGEPDEGLDSVQYWAFNALGLLTQSVQYQPDGLMLLNTSRGSTTSTVDKKRAYDVALTGFTTYGGKTTEGVPRRNFYPPFPYYIKNRTNFFNDDASIVVGCTDSRTTYAPDDGVASSTGLTIYTDDPEKFLTFFKYGLGLNVASSEEELNGVNSKDFAPIPPPNGEITDDNPGSGGITGGGTGGGSGIGGTTEGETSDIIAPGIPSTGSNLFANAWGMDETNVKELQKALVDPSMWESLGAMFSNEPSEGVQSLIKMPFNLERITTIADQPITVINNTLNDVKGTALPHNLRSRIELGTLKIPERFGSFLDYQYTNITIYIPFFGFKQIDTGTVMGRMLKLSMNVDYSDGSAIAIISVSNNKAKGNDWGGISSGGFTPYYTYNSNIGQQIPLTRSDKSNKTQNAIKGVLTTAAMGATAVATGGASLPASVGVLASSAVSNGVNSGLTPTRYSGGGTVNALDAYAVAGLEPYAIIEYPETNMPTGFNKIKGYQTNLYTPLENVSGFTQVNEAKTSGIPCTETEKKALTRLLESGVIIQ